MDTIGTVCWLKMGWKDGRSALLTTENTMGGIIGPRCIKDMWDRGYNKEGNWARLSSEASRIQLYIL